MALLAEEKRSEGPKVRTVTPLAEQRESCKWRKISGLVGLPAGGGEQNIKGQSVLLWCQELCA